MQAAMGVAQRRKLDEFVAARKRNHATLAAGLKKHERHLILHAAPPKSDPSWFGFVITVRPEAPWCPSNLEFIRRINGLASVEAVRDILFQASYLVMGLGDVYLGAPVATPVNPCHRLGTTKYNPAPPRTAGHTVGIRGSSPGG